MESLVKSLEELRITAVIPCGRIARDFDEKVLIIKDYALSTEDKIRICMALSLEEVPNFPKRMWISVHPDNIKGGPIHSPDSYTEFEYEGIYYYSYSVVLDNYTCEAYSIRSLMRNIYNRHINFEGL